MARFNKMFTKKLYMPDSKEKGQLDKMSQVTATATELNYSDGALAANTGTNKYLLTGTSGAVTLAGVLTAGASIAANAGITFAGHTTVTESNIILGGVGRISTGTFAGAALTVPSTATQNEGIYLRYSITGFSGSDFKGAYIRAEANTNAATAKSLYGTYIMGVNNAVTQTTGSLWGTLTYAYIKGATAVTINNVYAGQFEFSMDAGRSADATISTEAAVLLCKITAGDMADETKLHGIIIRAGDMDGDSETFGNGILIEDDGDMSGTCGFTTGLNISASTTHCIDMATPTGAIFKMVSDDTIVSDANQSILVDISATANAGFIKVILDTATVKYIALYDVKAA